MMYKFLPKEHEKEQRLSMVLSIISLVLPQIQNYEIVKSFTHQTVNEGSCEGFKITMVLLLPTDFVVSSNYFGSMNSLMHQNFKHYHMYTGSDKF